MPSPYKTASNELIQWILSMSGLDLAQEVTVNEIVELARSISTRSPPTALPQLMHDRFKSVIYLRSAAHRFWSRVESLNPSEEIRASNTSHKIFINALQEAFDLLARDGSVTEANPGAHSPSLGRDNLYSCLTVYITEDTEAEHPGDDQPTPGVAGPAEVKVERKRKKKKTRSKTKGSKTTPIRRTPEAKRAALCFIRELESLRKFIADTWREVASGQLNTAIAGALSLTATKIVEELQDRLLAEFEQCGSFLDIIDLINLGVVSPDRRELTCMDAHRGLVRFIDACRQRSQYLLATLTGADDVSSQYCLLAMVEEFGCPQGRSKLGPTKLVHDIIALILLGGPDHFTKRLRPGTVFSFQVILDSIKAANESQNRHSDPPHLADLRRFQSRLLETTAILRIRLKERNIQIDLDVLQILRSAVEGLGVTRIWKLCPWICGVGLALAVDAVSDYGTQLWTQSGIPLMLFHFYSILRQRNMTEKNEFLESLWKMCAGRVIIPEQQPEEQEISLPRGAKGNIQSVPYKRKRRQKGCGPRQGVGESPIWRTKLDCFNRVSPLASLSAARWNPFNVAGKNCPPQGKSDLCQNNVSVLERIKFELLLDITGQVPVAGLDLLLILLAFDMFFKDVFWTEISDAWTLLGLEEPVFGDFQDVVFQWVMSVRDNRSLELLLLSIGDTLSQNLQDMHVSVFRYFAEVGGTGST